MVALRVEKPLETLERGGRVASGPWWVLHAREGSELVFTAGQSRKAGVGPGARSWNASKQCY
jgi:hypothetical protein